MGWTKMANYRSTSEGRVKNTQAEKDEENDQRKQRHFDRLRSEIKTSLKAEAKRRNPIDDWDTLGQIRAIRGAVKAATWDGSSPQQTGIDLLNDLENNMLPAVGAVADSDLEALRDEIRAQADDPFAVTGINGTADDPGGWVA